MDYASTANLDSWRDTLETNLLGTLRLTQATVPHIGRGGAVVMINTMAARKIPPLGEAGYAASKAALANSVKWLAKELGPKGIRVNSVHMGWMWGAPVEGYINWQSQESKIPVDTLKAQIAADIPLGHIPTDDDCAKAALFMVSDYAAAVTGAALDANGGAFMP
jgi:NAD(P)-dependent dehydrogenase (short-subunit alcohol dehydrogenase family)